MLLPILLADIRSPLPARGSGSMVIAGLLLAAFFVIAGIRIVKRKKGRNRKLGVLLGLASLHMFLAARSYADIAPPPPPGKPIAMEIRMDNAAAGGPILRVPRSALAGARAENFGGGMQLVIGGAFLSCALVLGGMWLVRRRPKAATAVTMTAAAMVAIGASFLGGAMWAQDRALRPTAGDLNGSVEPGQSRSGVVALQIVPGDQASLLLPPPRRRPGPPPRQ